jgi:hypothetical protein
VSEPEPQERQVEVVYNGQAHRWTAMAMPDESAEEIAGDFLRHADVFVEAAAVSGPRIIRVLDASTSHLPEQVCEDLNGWDGVIAYAVSNSDDQYGWLLHVPQDPVAKADDSDGFPSEVLTLQRFARGLDCDYVLLDRDAEQVEGLPTWDW